MAPATSALCAYCGDQTAKPTRDHVVPSTLWGGRGFRPQHPIIVPACLDCQHKYDSEAEYFRNCLVAMLDRNCHPVAERLLTTTVTKSLERSRRAIADFVRGIRVVPRTTSSGIITGHALGFQIDLVRINRIIEKIVRGLYYAKSNVTFPGTHEILIFDGNGFWQEEQIRKLIDEMSPHKHQGDDVFSCSYVRDNLDPDRIAWLFRFYSHVGFFVLTERIMATT